MTDIFFDTNSQLHFIIVSYLKIIHTYVFYTSIINCKTCPLVVSLFNLQFSLRRLYSAGGNLQVDGVYTPPTKSNSADYKSGETLGLWSVKPHIPPAYQKQEILNYL